MTFHLAEEIGDVLRRRTGRARATAVAGSRAWADVVAAAEWCEVVAKRGHPHEA